MIQTEIQPQTVHSDTPPTVSVIIPAYNAAKYIGEALNSVFDQTFRSHESIVINDGSPDTVELERELQAYRANIRYIKQRIEGRPRRATLACVAHAENMSPFSMQTTGGCPVFWRSN